MQERKVEQLSFHWSIQLETILFNIAIYVYVIYVDCKIESVRGWMLETNTSYLPSFQKH